MSGTLSMPAAACLLLCGCASAPARRAGVEGFVGWVAQPTPAGFQLLSVADDGPAADAGLRAGDLVTRFDDADLLGFESRKAVLGRIRASPGFRARLAVLRDGKTLAKKLSIGTRDAATDELYGFRAQFSDELNAQPNAAVAIVVEQVNFAGRYSAEVLAQWRAGIKSALEADWEQYLLKAIARRPDFKVVDRDETDKLMSELRLQSTGAVDPQTARQLGKLAGASHLLVVNYTRYPDGKDAYQDSSTLKLLSVETGAVVAAGRRTTSGRR